MVNTSTELQDIITTIQEFLPLLIPVILIQWALMITALVKLFKSEAQPKFMPKWAWALVIIFVNMIGPIAYLIIGRREE